MNRRLYFLLPDVTSAHEIMHDLLLARVNDKHIHFIARPGMPLGDLPEATLSERTELLVKGWETGVGLGALFGIIAGLLAMAISTWWVTVPVPIIIIVSICVAIGFASAGLWTELIASAVANYRLKPFKKQIAHGKVLMIVLVPFHRVKDIRTLVAKKHPEANYKGTWPSDHVMFP